MRLLPVNTKQKFQHAFAACTAIPCGFFHCIIPVDRPCSTELRPWRARRRRSPPAPAPPPPLPRARTSRGCGRCRAASRKRRLPSCNPCCCFGRTCGSSSRRCQGPRPASCTWPPTGAWSSTPPCRCQLNLNFF